MKRRRVSKRIGDSLFHQHTVSCHESETQRSNKSDANVEKGAFDKYSTRYIDNERRFIISKRCCQQELSFLYSEAINNQAKLSYIKHLVDCDLNAQPTKPILLRLNEFGAHFLDDLLDSVYLNKTKHSVEAVKYVMEAVVLSMNKISSTRPITEPINQSFLWITRKLTTSFFRFISIVYLNN